MQKVLKRILSFGLAVVMCFGITVIVRGASAEYVVADAAASDTYYSGITAKGGNALLGQLHDLITTTHKTYTSYDDCKRYGPVTDPGPNGGAMEFYTHRSVMSFSGSLGTWNREHVWCQSLSNGLWGTSGGGSDLHHIRPSEGGLNSTRGNNKYGMVSGGKEAWQRDSNKNNVALGGHVGGGAFEPLDNVKGDAARIVMYVYTHYNTYKNVYGTTNGSGRGSFGTLNFTHVMSAGSEDAAKKLLLEWNRLDPVDDIERYRNEEVYKIQGNRNPFIDNSSYAEAIWGSGTVTPPDEDPSVTLTGLTVSPSSINMSVGQTRALTVTPVPANASRAVSWSTSNASVATVSDGTVTAKGEGAVTITATSTVNSAIKATATVTVKATAPSPASTATIDISKFSLSGSYAFHKWSADGIGGSAFIYGGNSESMQFNSSRASYYIASDKAASAPIREVTVKLNPKSTDKEWKLLTSSAPYGEAEGNPSTGNDRGTKTVTQEGVTWTVDGNDTYFALVYASTGACYIDSIVIKFGDGGGAPVDPIKPPEVKPESISIIPSSVTLEEGEQVKLLISFVPAGTKAEVSWTSSNPAAATVGADGTVAAVAEGTATITATIKENPSVKATAAVTVTEKNEPDIPVAAPEGLTVNPSSLSLKQGGNLKLTAIPVPADASAEVIWTSSDENIVLVAQDGTIIAVAAGTATVTASSKYDKNVKANVTVTVKTNDPVDNEKTAAFRSAVEGILSSGTLEERIASINKAKTAYNALSDAEKVSVKDAVAALNTAIADYNTAGKRIEAFRSAVSGIVSEGPAEVRFTSIDDAITAYKALTETDKTAVQTEIKTLNTAISEYNSYVSSYNTGAQNAEFAAINGVCGFFKR